MKKQLLLLGLFFLIGLLLLSPTVYAHFPVSDNQMTVLLHVDPDHKPIPEEQAMLYFLFDDASHKFHLSDCTCMLSITEYGKEIYTHPLTEKKDKRPSIWTTSSPYVFPHRDMYHIVLTGRPLTPYAFQPFTVSWNFRVAQYPKPKPIELTQTLLFCFVIIVSIFILISAFVFLVSSLIEKTKRTIYTKKK